MPAAIVTLFVYGCGVEVPVLCGGNGFLHICRAQWLVLSRIVSNQSINKSWLDGAFLWSWPLLPPHRCLLVFLLQFKVVFDAVYTPRETRLLRDAAAAGCLVVDGVAMFVGQAVEQLKLFTGVHWLRCWCVS